MISDRSRSLITFFWSFNKNAEVKLQTAALAIIINSLNSSAVKLMFTTQKYKVYIVCGYSFFHYLKKLNFWPASETKSFGGDPSAFTVIRSRPRKFFSFLLAAVFLHSCLPLWCPLRSQKLASIVPRNLGCLNFMPSSDRTRLSLWCCLDVFVMLEVEETAFYCK